MIIATKQYLKHSYWIGGINLFKTAVYKILGLINPNGPFQKVSQSYLAKGAKFYYPVLEVMEGNSLKCVSCGLCEKICPTKCIEIVKNKNISISSQAMNFGPPPTDFKIDLRQCIQCGLCEEVCPVSAISLSGEYNVLDQSVKIWGQKELSEQSKPPRQEF